MRICAPFLLNILKLPACIIACTICACSHVSQSETFAPLKQLEGSWKAQDSVETVYETWNVNGPQELFGKSYIISGTDTILLETTKLSETSKGIFYIPVVAGQNRGKPVLFRLVSSKAMKFVFENKDHNYPQRIIYHITDSNSIHAWIEGKKAGKEARSDYYFKKVGR